MPPELSGPEQQCSGLSLDGTYLYLLPENRYPETAGAALYRIDTAKIGGVLSGSADTLRFRRCPVIGLPRLMNRMRALGCRYEGMEALAVRGNTLYITVETTTRSPYGFLLKGHWADTTIYMDTLAALPKPLTTAGNYVYNAGFEALQLYGDKIYAFFEYNNLPAGNQVWCLDTALHDVPEALRLQRLPFRLTDISPGGDTELVALNYFYKGDTDSAYRPTLPAEDSLVRDRFGAYTGYCRLVRIRVAEDGLDWQPYYTFPPEWRSCNWEGIAAYRSGYLLVNDKYTAQGPNRTLLVYLQLP